MLGVPTVQQCKPTATTAAHAKLVSLLLYRVQALCERTEGTHLLQVILEFLFELLDQVHLLFSSLLVTCCLPEVQHRPLDIGLSPANQPKPSAARLAICSACACEAPCSGLCMHCHSAYDRGQTKAQGL